MTPLQALAMYNGAFVNEEARYFAERLRQHADAPDQRIQRAFELAFSRPPTEQENERLQKFLAAGPPEETLVGLCRILYNSNEFIYVD